MSPNLLLAAQKLVHPLSWLSNKGRKDSGPLRRTEQWQDPVAGLYEFKPGVGWFLVATKNDTVPSFNTLAHPRQVQYCRALHRWLFLDEFSDRQKDGFIVNDFHQRSTLKFFRMHDQITWIQCYNQHDEFIPGPYARYVFDENLDKFRPMLKQDDPRYRRLSAASNESRLLMPSHSKSPASSLHISGQSSRATSPQSSRPPTVSGARHATDKHDSLAVPTGHEANRMQPRQ